ncbi:MAG: methylenetetrahydrofolate reductase [Bacteroidales bacterium]|nr:methylenetetrahydrofolate reductase [Bacteroidales bacterium]
MKVPQIIAQATAARRTRFAFEILPPLKGDGIDPIYASIDELLEFDPAYINITCHRETLRQSVRSDGSAEYHMERRRPGTVGIAAAIERKYGVPAVPHLICAGESKYTIEDQLIDMDFLGLENLLVLRGDKMPGEAAFRPSRDGYSHAADLVRQVMAMNRGILTGRDSESPAARKTGFAVGVAGYPETHAEAVSPEDDILRLKEKVDAGAQYIITQLFYNNTKFFDFVSRCRAAGISVPIIPGIKPLTTVRQLTLLPQTFGCSIPQELSEMILANKDDALKMRRAGLDWCTAQCRELIASGVPVLHFFPNGRPADIYPVAEALF